MVGREAFIACFLGLELLSSAGCSLSSPHSEISTITRASEIIIGRSTQQDVSTLLGNPDWTGMSTQNEKLSNFWGYGIYQHPIIPPTFFPATSHPGEPGWYGKEELSEVEFETLIISYTPDGIVEDLFLVPSMAAVSGFRATMKTTDALSLPFLPTNMSSH